MSSILTQATRAVVSVAGRPLCQLAEKAATRLLCNIANGTLIIHTPDRDYHFGQDQNQNDKNSGHDDSEIPGAVAELTVKEPTFWLRLCAMGDLGFAEAYMYGEVDCEDLVKVFQIFLANKAHLSAIDNSLLSRVASHIPNLGWSEGIVNTVVNARKNISAHYDISNAMFIGFLSSDMTYSCGIFPDLDGDVRTHGISHTRTSTGSSTPPLTGASTPSTLADETPDLVQDKIPLYASPLGDEATPDASLQDDPLEVSQLRKLSHIIQKADIRPGHRVLEIGSGWGSMSLLITSNIPDTIVDTLTLSTQQAALTQERAKAAGLSDRIRVHLLDYRNMPANWEGKFDRVVSVEMVEAVGREYMETYFSKIDWALNKTTGVGVVQGITIPEARFDRYMREVDFIRKWVLFPGGFLPTLTFLIDALHAGSHGKLVVDAVSNIGPHYARTLREWRQRFEAHFDDVIVPALRTENAAIGELDEESARREIEVFRRKWLYYFCYCEIGFTNRLLGDHIITFTREGNVEYGCQVFS